MGARALVEGERDALVRLLEHLEPEQWGLATCCAGWDVADLIAHLVVRGREPLAGPGILLPGPFAAYTDRRRRARKARGLRALLRDLRTAHPSLPAGARANLVEFFVHHEDVRRGELQRPREEPLPSAYQEALWRQIGGQARLQLARLRADGIAALRTPDGREVSLRLDTLVPLRSHAPPDVTVTGAPGELVLWLTGRTEVADIEVTGEPELVGVLRSAKLGI